MDSSEYLSCLLVGVIGCLFIFLIAGIALSDGSYAEINQSGGESIAMITQVGDGNTAMVEQSDGDRNETENVQEGNENQSLAKVFGDENTNCFADLTSFFGQNVITSYFQWQFGNSNEQMVVVEGNNNFISQSQKGDGNFQELRVEGDGNMVKQIQQGDNNVSVAEIKGNENVLFHLQKGSGLFFPIISIVGDFKQVSVIQE